MADTSITREERYLEYLTGDRKGNVPKPVTRRERYLYELCLKGIGGEISPEEIKNAVNEYLEKNPVKPGATTEQVQQIEQNKTDIVSLKTETSSLKEDLSTKISKFYASSQGETHLADSDNGKIMDMMVYGKSEQKQYTGKNLLNATLQTTTLNGVTCTNNGDGTFTLNGTASSECAFTIGTLLLGNNQQYKIVGCPLNIPNGIKLFAGQNASPWNSYGSDEGSGHVFTTNMEAAKTWILIPNDCVCNNLLFKPMIVDASLCPDATYDDFEPYTGGIPSPNPDYPQEIKSVVNPTVKVCGKNLIDTGEIKAFRNVTISNGTVKQATADKRTELQWKIMQYDLKNNILETNSSNILQSGTRFGVVFTAKEKVKRIVFGLNGLKIDTTVAISVDLKVGAKYIISCNLLNSTQGSIEWNDMMLEEGTTIAAYEPYHEQTVTLPYTLNAIPVSSGGNVVIDGQQYIADYVDVERGKLVKTVDSSKLDNTQSIVGKTEWLLAESQETDLTTGEITAFKALATYYPTTNISISSEQLDGYTVFNYPMPFEDEWIKTKKDVDSLKARLNDIVGYDNAAAHNSIYRGKNLGTQFTAEMSANIKNGTFKDLYCGDYLVINGTTYRFMDLDYLYKTGDTSLETHHILVVPDAPMYNHVMNDTNTTSGGYVGSKMYISGLDQALAKIKADFGEAHIVTYRNLLVNTVSNGIPSSWAWYSRQIDLMNEEMVYGTRAWSQATQNGYDTSSNKSQLAAFKHNHSLISSCRSWYWLRAVYSSTDFCNVGSSGNASLNGASDAGGVRPCFLIS